MVGLGIQQGIDEGAAFGLVDAIQIDPHIAELLLELGQRLVQRGASPPVVGIGAWRQLLGPVGAGDQNAVARQIWMKIFAAAEQRILIMLY